MLIKADFTDFWMVSSPARDWDAAKRAEPGVGLVEGAGRGLFGWGFVGSEGGEEGLDV